MAQEELGTAVVRLSVDTASYAADMTKAENRLATLGQAAVDAFRTANDVQKRALLSLALYKDSIGKSADEVQLLKKQIKGLGAETLAGTAASINATRDALASAAKSAREFEDARQQATAANNVLRALDAEVAALGKDRIALKEAELATLGLANAGASAIAALRAHEQALLANADAAKKMAAAESAAAADNAFYDSVVRQGKAIGKSRIDLLEMEAAERGLSAALAPTIAELRKEELQLKKTGKEFNEYGLSQKQTVAAMRQVPAQITDIFVSLQGGQAPLTVLIQQGGQLKDVFGGIKPAAAALGQGLRALITPYTALAVAIGGVIALYLDAESRSNALNRALILTGQNSETSAGQIRDLANEMDALYGVTARGAETALTAVINTGNIAVASQTKVAQAALAMQQATGKAIGETIQQFVELQRDPVSAAAKLTETTGFLTLEVLQQARAYEEQGEFAKAAQLVTGEYADYLISRSAEIKDSLGGVTTAWGYIKIATGEAIDTTTSYFERANRFIGKEIELLNKLRKARTESELYGTLAGGLFGDGGLFGNEVPAENPAAKQARETLRLEQVRQENELHSLRMGNRTREQAQLAEELKIANLIRATNKGASKEELDALIAIDVAASRAKFNESKPKDKSGRSIDNAQSRLDLQEFKGLLAEQQAALQADSQLLNAQYGARLISQQDYFNTRKALIERDFKIEQDALLGQIASLKDRNATGKDALDVQRQILELESKVAVLRIKNNAENQALQIEEARANKERINGLRDYRLALESNNRALEEQVAASIRQIGVGQQAAAQEEKLIAIKIRLRDEIEKLKRASHDDPTTAADNEERIKALQENADRELEITRTMYSNMLVAQADWLNGVKTGVANWAEQINNVSDQIQSITTRAMDSAADAITNFATTGKLEIKELLRSILTDIIKFLAKRAVLNFITAFFPGLGAGGAGVGTSVGGSGGFALPPLKFAKGGTFTNSVVSTPTLFKFARGTALGEMGEAGPEGILPLSRGPGGKLGVTMYGGSGGSGPVSISVQTNITETGTSTQTEAKGDRASAYNEFSREMANVAEKTLQKALRPGGTLWRVGVTEK